MRTASLLLSLSCTILILTGCAANGPTREVGPAGGKIAMDNVAVVNIPAGTFTEPTTVRVERRSLRAADENIGIAGLLFDVEQPTANELRIVAESSGQPAKPIELQIDVPRDLREAMEDDDRTGPDAPVLRVFARNVWGSETNQKLITLEPLPGWSDPRSRTVSVMLPPHLFSRTKENNSAAMVRLALTRLAPAPIPPSPHPSDSPLSAADTTPVMSADELTLAPPLLGSYRSTTPFGSGSPASGAQFHPGVNLAPDASLEDAGRAVHAMAGGTVMAAGEQVDHDGNAMGLGGFVVIGHGVLGAAPYTLYAGLDPQSIRVAQEDTLRRGDVIGEVATAGEGRSGALHLEYVPRPMPENHGLKADPMASLGRVFVEHLVAGYRSTSLIRIPAIDSNADFIELVGNEADNQWWSGHTDARTSDKINGRTLTYQSKTGGDVETILDRNGLRVHFSTDGQPRVSAGKRDASNPSEASAAGTGGGRIRFLTTTPARYRLHVKYAVDGPGEWSIQHRFQKAGDAPAKPTDVNKEFATFPASGKDAVKYEKTFEGSLDQPGRYDFDFLPTIEIGGGSNRTAKLKAMATLEVMPGAGGEAK